MVGWHHRLDGHEFEQALGAGDGQGSLACCSPWGCKESDTTEGLNNNNNHHHQKAGGRDSADTWGVDFWPPELTQYFLVI